MPRDKHYDTKPHSYATRDTCLRTQQEQHGGTEQSWNNGNQVTPMRELLTADKFAPLQYAWSAENKSHSSRVYL